MSWGYQWPFAMPLRRRRQGNVERFGNRPAFRPCFRSTDFVPSAGHRYPPLFWFLFSLFQR